MEAWPDLRFCDPRVLFMGLGWFFDPAFHRENGRPQTTMACPTATTVPWGNLQRLYRDEPLAEYLAALNCPIERHTSLPSCRYADSRRR